MPVDPVLLVRGPERQDAMFRCVGCGALQIHPEILPTGGSPCVSCQAPIRVSDRIEFASVGVRLVALAIDVMLFAIPYFLFAVATFSFSGLLSRDEQGNLTAGATLILRILGVALLSAYVVAYELSSPSVGKRLLGLRVVRSSDWHPPSILQRFARLGAKILTIATLGIGYVAMMLDSQRRALHDRLVGTRVIQN